uniref:UDP-glycosyltransferase n=1 Tax=Daucus carota subsp. sativus TaxID=79200 RepID=A0A162AHR5_DAUCS
MMRVELIFMPVPEVGHLVATAELAKLLVGRDERISVRILIQKMPYDTGFAGFTQKLKKDVPERIDFVDIPAPDETTMAELKALPLTSFHEAFVSNQRTVVRDIVTAILKQSETSKLGGFVLDLFTTPMIEVANDFNVPAYVFFTSSAAYLNIAFYAQDLKDSKNLEISGFKNLDIELSVPGFSNLVPAKGLPAVILDEAGSALMRTIARRLRKTKAIFLNTVLELEARAIKALEEDGNTPVIYHVVEITLDYRKDLIGDVSPTVTAQEIELGIRRLMNAGSEMRNKVKAMKDLCRKANNEGGSSYSSLGQFIEEVIDNIN